jgi:signal transduction histidine kinase
MSSDESQKAGLKVFPPIPKGKSLYYKILSSHLKLAGFSMIVLLISLGFLIWLRLRAIDLAAGIGPIVQQPDLLIEISNLVLVVLIVGIVLVFMISIIMSIRLSKSITLPLKKLSNIALKISNGDSSVRADVGIDDEVGRLADSFNHMTENLAGYQAALSENVTILMEQKKTLQEAKRSLNRSNKELEEFAYVASHDLQEPLRMIASYTELLKEDYVEKFDDRAKEFMHYIVDGAERMQRLIKDLLQLSRVGTRGKPFEKFDTKKALEDALTNLEVRIKENQATVKYHEMPVICGDVSQITQLFQNLVGNAIKFHGEKKPQIYIQAQKQETEWLFILKDNGIGMERKYFERIFTMFQRLHSRAEYEGTGIGLTVCKKIVERHGGRIWVESKQGSGSTFYFTIPMEPKKGEAEYSGQAA